METIKVIGAGLAGCEAAWQLAQRGIPVALHEMKPERDDPGTPQPGVCGAGVLQLLRAGDRLENAVGLLKEELRRAGSLILTCAEATRGRGWRLPGSRPLRLLRAGDGEDPQSPEYHRLFRRSDRGPGAAGDHRDGAADV